VISRTASGVGCSAIQEIRIPAVIITLTILMTARPTAIHRITAMREVRITEVSMAAVAITDLCESVEQLRSSI
jgi:hypothetical protein